MKRNQILHMLKNLEYEYIKYQILFIFIIRTRIPYEYRSNIKNIFIKLKNSRIRYINPIDIKKSYSFSSR